MTVEKDPRDVADQLSCDIDYIRTLLSAAGDKVRFYLENKKLLGPYMELLYGCALEIDNLLSLVEQHLEKMDRQTETLTDLLYRAELSETAR